MSSKGGGSSGGTTSQTSTVTPNPQALAAYQQALTMANTASSAPLQTYPGQTVAGFTPDQLAAFQTVSGTQGAAAPYLNTASQDIQSGTTPLWSGVPQFSTSNVDQYESPYTQNVLDTTMAAENNQDAQQQQQVKGSAISAGAWGGDRSAVAAAQTAGQEAIANNATNAGIENTGYSTALGEFNNQQQSELSANEANAYLGEQAGFGNLNLASAATNLPLTQAAAQNATGTEEQTQAQENLNVPYEEFLQQQAYPFQTAQYYADIAEGIAPGMGSTSTGDTTSPSPSTGSEVLGGAETLGGLSLLSPAGTFSGPNGLLSFAKEGGRIKRDSGGIIPGLPQGIGPIAGVPQFSLAGVPQTNGQGARSLQVQLPRTSGTQGNENPLSGVGGISRLASLAKIGGNGGGASGDVPGFNGLISGLTGKSGGNGYVSSASDLNNEVSGDVAAQDAGNVASSGSTWNSLADSISNIFASKGGRMPQFRTDGRNYDIGGEVLPDVVSGVGDLVGAFFGDPMAGSQGTSVLSALDDGRTSKGLQLSRGGRPSFDDGGSISPISGAAPSSATSSQVQQNFYQQISQLPMDKLQELSQQMPPTTPQGQMVQKVIQQKQFQPNAGQSAVAGLSTPQDPQGGQALPSQQQTGAPQPQAGLAAGGRPGYDDGGDIPSPLTPDQIAAEQAEIQGLSPDNNDATIPAINASALNPPTSAASAQPVQGISLSAQQAASPPSQSIPLPQYADASLPQSKVSQYEPPSASESSSRDIGFSLLAAGLGTLGGKSPYAMQNIGAGGLEGLKTYAGLKQNEAEYDIKGKQIDQEGQRLADQAEYQNKQLGQSASQFNTKQTTISAQEQADLDLKNRQLAYQQRQFKAGELIKDAWGNVTGRYDPVTQSIVPVAGANSGMIPMPASANSAMGMPMNGQSALASTPPVMPSAASLPSDMQDRLAKYPPNMQPMFVEAIQGRIPIDRSHFGNNVMAAQQAIADIDPSFDLANPTSRMKTATGFSPDGKEGQTITSLNTASRHGAQLALNLLAMNNRSFTPWNYVANNTEKAFGADPMTNATAVLNQYAPEAAKVARGGTGVVPVGEIEEIKNGIPLNGSVNQQLGAMMNTNDVMLSKADELQTQYNKAMGPIGQQKQVVSPQALTALRDIQDLYAYSKNGKLDSPEAKQTAEKLDAYVKWYDKNNGANGQTGAQSSAMSAQQPTVIQYQRVNGKLVPMQQTGTQ